MKKLAGPMLALLSFCICLGLGAQEEGGGLGQGAIQIVIPDMRGLSDNITKNELDNIAALLRIAVSNRSNLRLLERSQNDEIFNEIAFQVSGLGEISFKAGKIKGATALLMGTVGTLYGRTVITTRLVHLETGQILFADSIYVENDGIKTDIEALANSIEEKAMVMTLKADMPSIRQQMRAKNYSEADRLIGVYLRNNNQADAEIVKMKEEISLGLANQRYREAGRYLNQRLFNEARLRVNEALALKVDERFYVLRRRIDEEESRYQLEQRVASAKFQAQLEREQAGAKPRKVFDAAAWLASISERGAHIGASYQPSVDPDGLELSLADGEWGLSFLWLGPVKTKTPPDPKKPLRWTSYLGLDGQYVTGAGGNLVRLGAYLSPMLCQSIKLGNIILSTGLDGGGRVDYGGAIPGGYGYSLDAGASALLDIKFDKGSGAYIGARAGYCQAMSQGLASGPFLRLYGGLVF